MEFPTDRVWLWNAFAFADAPKFTEDSKRHAEEPRSLPLSPGQALGLTWELSAQAEAFVHAEHPHRPLVGGVGAGGDAPIPSLEKPPSANGMYSAFYSA